MVSSVVNVIIANMPLTLLTLSVDVVICRNIANAFLIPSIAFIIAIFIGNIVIKYTHFIVVAIANANMTNAKLTLHTVVLQIQIL